MRTRTKEKIFDPGGIWTQDLQIRSPLLYQLSYEAKPGAGIHPLTDERADSQLRLQSQSAFDGALKVEVPAIEGTRGERTTAGLMPLGLFLFLLGYFGTFGDSL